MAKFCVEQIPVICQRNCLRSSKLVINQKTAKALGLMIPNELLVRADEMIRSTL